MDHIKLEKGENHMFRRVLIKKLYPNEPKNRRDLFRIRCKILRKVCKEVVDSCSTENITSEEVVNMLKLTKKPHVNSYKVTWLNKGQSILVNEQTWVDFCIKG